MLSPSCAGCYTGAKILLRGVQYGSSLHENPTAERLKLSASFAILRLLQHMPETLGAPFLFGW